MSQIINIQKERKKLNAIYRAIIKNKNLPNDDFDFIMKLWVVKNEKLEAKEQKLSSTYVQTIKFGNNSKTFV